MRKIKNLSLILLVILAFTACQKEYMGPESSIGEQIGNSVETYNCESAYAKGNYVFTRKCKSNPEKLPSLNISEKWGWAIKLTEDTSYYKIYSGAGNNDVSKGSIVAYLRIIRNGDDVRILYAVINGYTLTEAHIYASDRKPQTASPGKFGNTFNFTYFTNNFETTIKVNDRKDDGIWIIAHAVICQYIEI